MNWIEKLKERWKVKGALQVIIILGVFACTGLSVMLLKRPIFTYLFNAGPMPFWATVVYYILILPIYNLFLLLYGFIFGQFYFFWNFEKRTINRIFKRRETTNPNKP